VNSTQLCVGRLAQQNDTATCSAYNEDMYSCNTLLDNNETNNFTTYFAQTPSAGLPNDTEISNSVLQTTIAQHVTKCAPVQGFFSVKHRLQYWYWVYRRKISVLKTLVPPVSVVSVVCLV